jgi:hypothetical protein
MVVKIPKKLEMKSLLPAPRSCTSFSRASPCSGEVQIYELRKHQERCHRVQVYLKIWVMDGIATLRGCSHWAYVQENKFPGQGSDSDKVFVFKMSEVGPGSGVHLVN